MNAAAHGIEVLGSDVPHLAEVLTPDAVRFAADLHRAFHVERHHLLQDRVRRQRRLDGGEMPDFLPNPIESRDPDWRVAPAPADLDDRRVEITGPAEPKMMINALNSRRIGLHVRLRGCPLPHLGERRHRPLGGRAGRAPDAHVRDR